MGVLDNGELMVNEEGSAQGNIISPILANIYMHNVLTLWYKFIITKAIEAGHRALNSLSTAKENLNSAKNWGLVDMFGGGFFSTMLKHSKMDQAKQNMEQAKYDLRNFSRELNDVNMACNLHIDTGNFLSFADYFFDGFVVDWMVQDRINNAKRQVEEAIRRTESIVNQLQRM